MQTLRLKAYAKVNLCLEILSRREDGYHEIRTIYQSIALYDELELSPFDTLSLAVEPNGFVPTEGNLVLEAAELLRIRTGIKLGAYIRLKKRIPTSAGLGGGSSDAASTLLGLRKLWSLHLADEEVLDIGAALGSDVPFFIKGGTALGKGRGEILDPIPTPNDYWAVIICSDEGGSNKTARLYNLLKPNHYSIDDKATISLAESIATGHIPNNKLFNGFESVAPLAFPHYQDMKSAFHRAGAKDVHLAGSGPSLFTVTHSKADALGIQRALQGTAYACYFAKLIPEQ